MRLLDQAMETNLILSFIPLFLVLMAIEVAYGIWVRNNTYRLNDVISSLSQGLISQSAAICTPLFQIGAYQWIFNRVGNRLDFHFWETGYGWILALLIYDFTDYWLHRFSHHCSFFWGAHVIHHQSQFFNLSTALRQESLYPLIGCFFFSPMALLGIPVYEYASISVFVLVYQFWIHTEHIGRLSWFDKVFSSPSNHRVHHAINDEYINKNFAAVFIVWDRLFGTYQVEGSKCIYGTKTQFNSWNPIKALTFSYAQILHNCSVATNWPDRLKAFYKDPSWAPDSLSGKPARLNPATGHPYSPPYSRFRRALVVVLFLLAFTMVCFSILYEDRLRWVEKMLSLMLVCLLLYCAGRFMESGPPKDAR